MCGKQTSICQNELLIILIPDVIKNNLCVHYIIIIMIVYISRACTDASIHIWLFYSMVGYVVLGFVLITTR